jgi:hypothetical protein
MNYYKEIIEHIKFYSKHSHSSKEDAECLILMHLIQIMGEEHFNTMFTYDFINRNDISFDERFFDFHKSMRQTDFYSETYKRIKREPTVDDKRKFEYDSIGGHLDMIFWNFIHISEISYKIFKTYCEEIKEKV